MAVYGLTRTGGDGSKPNDSILQSYSPAENDKIPQQGQITVNLATGETKFYPDYQGFLQGKAEYTQYCATQSSRC